MNIKSTLFLIEKTLSGKIIKRPIDGGKLVLLAEPGSVYAVVDAQTQKPPKKYALKRVGKSLLVDNESNGDLGSGITVVEIQDYYSAKGAYFATDGQLEAASQRLITEQSPPLARSTDQNVVIWVPEDDGLLAWWSQGGSLLGFAAIGAGVALSDGGGEPDRGVPPAPNLVQLDSSDNGNPDDGFNIRVGFDASKMKTGDKILLDVYGDPDGDGIYTVLDRVEHVLTNDDLTRGYAILETGAPDGGGTWGDGKYNAVATLQYQGGKTGPERSKDLIFTVLDGVVHDDWISSAAVFVDFNYNGQWDEGEPFTYTDQEGRFTFAFDPGAAPILAVGGVDTSSGRPNDGVVFEALPGLVDPTEDGVDFVLSNLTTVIASVARQLSAAAGTTGNTLPSNEVLAQAAQVVSNSLGLSLRDPTVLLNTDAVSQAGRNSATDLDKDILAANRQVSLLVASTSSLLRGAASSGEAAENDFTQASAHVTEALASLIVERQAANQVIQLSTGNDVMAVVQAAIENANTSGFTQELRVSIAADLTQLSNVIAAYNEEIDATTNTDPQGSAAQNLLRSASSILLPALQEAGIEASRERGGDISLSSSFAPVTAVNLSSLPSVSQSEFITQRASGFVGDYVPLDFQMPRLGVGDSVDYFLLYGLPPQVDLFVVDPRTREVTRLLPTSTNIDTNGPAVAGGDLTVQAYLVPLDQVGFLAVRVPLGSDVVRNNSGNTNWELGSGGGQDDARDYTLGNASDFSDNNAIWLFGENRLDASGNPQTVQAFSAQLQLNIIQRSSAPRVTDVVLFDDNNSGTSTDDTVIPQRGLTNDTTPRLDFKVTLPTGGLIKIYIDGSATPAAGVLTGPNASGQYSFEPNSHLTNGPHNFVIETVNGTDIFRTTPQYFTVDTQVNPPTLDPTDGSVVRGKGEPGATVVIYDSNNQPLGETKVDEQGSWEFKPATPIVDGSTLRAKQTDEAGNESGPSNSATVDGQSPSQKVTITAILDNVLGVVGPLGQGTQQDPTPTNDRTPEIQGTLSSPLETNEILVITLVSAGQTYEYTLTSSNFSADGKSWTLNTNSSLPDGLTQPVTLGDGVWSVDGVVDRVVGGVTKSGANSESYHLNIDTRAAGRTPGDPSGGDPYNDNLGSMAGSITANDDKGNSTGLIVDNVASRTDDSQPTFSGDLLSTLLEPGEFITAYAIKLDPAGQPVTNDDGSYVYIPLGKTTPDVNGLWSLTPNYALPDGPQSIVFFIEDTAGNRSKSLYPPYDFTVDTSSRVGGPSGVDGGDGSSESPYYILEGTDGSRSLVFTVSRGDGFFNQTMNWELNGMDPADVAGSLSGAVSFAAGQLTKLVTVAVLGDKEIEADETLTFTIDNGRDSSQSVVVRNDDSLFSISAPQSTLSEGNSGETRSIVYKISRQSGSSASSIGWSVDEGSSNEVSSANTGAVSFAVGELEKFITIQMTGDLDIETGEYVSVSLLTPGINAGIGLATAKVDIINDDLGVSVIAPPNIEIPEGGNFVFTLVRSDTSTGASVNYTLAGIGADPAYGVDFVGGALPGGTVSFAAGTGTILVTVQIASDSVVEPNEQFGIVLSNPVNTTILSEQIQGVIVNDDVGYTIQSMQGGNVLNSAQPLMGLASTLEGTGTNGQQIFKIVRTGKTNVSGEIDYAISGFADNGAVNNDFYNSLVNGTVSFAPNQTEAFITVNISADTQLEGYENYKVQLNSNNSNVQITRGVALATINPDDSGISIEAVNAMAFEDGGGLHTFNVYRTGYLGGSSVVRWEVQPTATNGVNSADFGGALPSGLITFAAGESVLSISFAPSADVLLETDEGYKVVLTSNQPGVVLLQPEAEGLLVNDELGLRFSASTATILSSAEGASDSDEDVSFTVERLGNLRALNRESVFSWSLIHDSSAVGDFAPGVALNGLVTFAPGETAKSVSIGLSGDNVIEGNKNFSIQITSETIGTEVIDGNDSVVGTILNDDAQFALQALASVQEGNSGTTQVVMTVVRTGDLSTTDTVNYAIELPAGSTASAADFAGATLPFGQVAFAPSVGTMQLTFALATDSVLEADETFSVVLSNNSANTNILSSATTQVVVITNDDDLVSIVATDANKSEGVATGSTSFVFSVVREPGSATDKSTVLDWTTSALGSNTVDRAGTDDFSGYSSVMPSGSVTIASGTTIQSFTINVAGDNDYEPDQGFRVSLTSPSGSSGTALQTVSADGLIVNDDTGISIAATTTQLNEGDTSSQAHVFTIIRYGVVTVNTTVQWAVSGDVNAADFGGTLPSGTVSFGPNETVQTITLLASGDVSIESNENFVVTLTNASENGDIDVASANGQIVADDVSISLSSHPAAILTEGTSGDQSLEYVVTRSGDMASAVVVNWAISGAVDSGDFRSGSALSGKVTFAAGQGTQSVLLYLNGDNQLESNEDLIFTLSTNSTDNAAHNRTYIDASSSTASVMNDDARLTPSALVSAQNEGNNSSTPFVFSVTPSGVFGSASVVKWNVTSSVADVTDFVTGQDGVGTYSGFPSGFVTFAAGQTVAALITVNVQGDTGVDADELFTVNLSTIAANVEIPTTTVSATITNDDTAYSLVAVNADKAEGNSGNTDYVFNVVRTGVLTDGAVVNWGVTGSGSNAAAAGDFVGNALPTGSVSFGLTETTKTVTIQVAGDLAVENDEGFTVTISGAPSPIITSTATGTIRNEDQQFSVTLNGNANVVESDSGTKNLIYTISRTGDTSAQATVQYQIAGGTGVNSSDYQGSLPSGVVTFGPNNDSQLVTVTLVGDNLAEGNETYTLTLSAPSAGTLSGTATSAAYIVTNDDLAIDVVAPTNTLEGNTAGSYTPFVFAVNRSDIPSSQTTVLDWKVQTLNVNSSDFRSGQDALSVGLPSGKLTFTGTQTQILVTVEVAQDALPELDESFSLVVENITPAQTNVELRTASASTTILNEDTGFAIDTVGTSSLAEGESAGHVFALTRSGELNKTASMEWAVSGVSSGNTANSADFAGSFPTGSISFGVSETVKYITITTSEDALAEFSENFQVNVSNARLDGVLQSAGVIANASATATIVNDDQNFNAASTAAFNEGNSGTNLIVFTVNRVGDGLTNTVATVQYAVTASGAVVGDDYVGPLPSGTLTFAENELSRSVTMTLKGDTVVESGESYTITLSNPSSGSTVGTASATTSISDDDTNYVLVAPSDTHEGHTGETTNVVFTVNKTGIASQASSVNWAVQGTSDLDTADFILGALPSGTLSFASGATQAFITLAVKGDVLLENDEAIRVLLSSPTGGSISGTDGDKSMNLLSDDDSFSISTTTANIFEGHPATNPKVVYTINRTGSLDFNRVIDYTITGVTSDDLVTPLSAHITFAAGSTQVLLTVEVQSDTATESDETMTVTLTTSEQNTVFAAGQNSAQTEIKNDDAKFKIETLFTPANEGNTSGQSLDYVFVVTRSGYLNQANTVNWSLVTNGVTNSVTPSTDLVGATSNSLSFGISETTKTVTIKVQSDSTKEENEVIRIQLSSPSAGSELDVDKTTADSTVTNDDAEVNITAGTTSLSEGDGGFAGTPFTYTLTRTGYLSQTSVVNWTVSGNGANATTGNDFSNGANGFVTGGGAYYHTAGFPSGSHTFASGSSVATVTLYVRGDDAGDSQYYYDYGWGTRFAGSTENDEGFRISLTTAANSGTSIGSGGTYDSTIVNDDTRLTISVDDYSQPEKTSTGGTTDYVYTVARSGLLTGTTTVNWAVSNGSTDATDFTGPTSGSLTFLANATVAYVTVKAQGDDTVEDNQAFNLTLSGGSGYDEVNAQGTNSSGLGTSGYVYTVIERDEAVFGVEGGSWWYSNYNNPYSGSATEGDTSNDASILGNTVPGADQPFVFSVFRDISTAGNSWVKWYVTGNGPSYLADGADFASGQNTNSVAGAFASGTLSFADGISRAYVTVMVKADDVSEWDETFQFQLDTTASGVKEGSSVGTKVNAYHTYVYRTITNDDTVFDAHLDSSRPTEGQNIVYYVDRTTDTRGKEILDWSIALPGGEASNEGNTDLNTWYKLDQSDLTRIDVESGGAASFSGKNWSADWTDGGINYTASSRTLSGTLTFADGDGRVYVTLGTVDDSHTETWYEQSPSMTISLPGAPNSSGANGFDLETARIINSTTSTTMVLDNEPEPVLSVSVVSGLATNNGVASSVWEGTDSVSPIEDSVNGNTVRFEIKRNWLDAARDGQDTPGYPATVAWKLTGDYVSFGNVNYNIQREVKSVSGDSSWAADSGWNNIYGYVTFAAGQTTKNVDITFYGDYYYQSDKNLRFEVMSGLEAYDNSWVNSETYGPTNTDTSKFANVGVDFQLLNDDITLSASGGYVDDPYRRYDSQFEGKNFVITINRSGRPDVAVKVDYNFTDGTATGTADYSATAGSVTFGVSESVKYVTVALTDDEVMEATQAFSVNLTGALVDPSTLNAFVQFDQTNSANKTLTATIYDEDSEYTITPQSSNQNEYDTADNTTAAYVFKVDWASTSADSQEVVRAEFRVIGSGGNPVDASDISNISYWDNYFRKADVTSRLITVYINKDSIIEPDEGFKLEVWRETRYYSGVTNTFTNGTFVSSEQLILNDDRGIKIQDASVVEQDVNNNLVFTVLREGSLSTTSTADWALNAGGNTADVTGVTSGQITFAPNIGTQFITITVVGDTLPEGNEQLTVNLSNLSNDVDNVASQLRLAAAGSINNDDSSFAVSAGADQAEGAGQVFTVTRTHATSQDQVINWAVTTTAQTDAAAADFAGASYPTGSVTFSGTELTRLVTITSAADSTKEDNEAFTFGISLGAGTTGDLITTASIGGAILNNDTGYEITAGGAASLNEGHTGVTNFVYTVTRSGNLTQPGTIAWSVSGAAVNASDFGLSTGLPGDTLTFAAGVTTLQITVGVVGDLAVENDEPFVVTLSSPTGGVDGNQIITATATSTIANDDSTVSITAVTASASEGNSATTNFVYKLVRVGSLSGDASVTYTVAGSGAEAANVNADDFTGLTGNIALQNGLGTTFLTVQVRGDQQPEMDEEFTVTLSNGVGVAIDPTAGANQATSTILADDTQFAIQVPGNQTESGSFSYVVTRTGVTSASQVLNWVIAGTGNDPASDTDFTDYAGSLTFAVGASVATLAVGLFNDTELENDETFRLTFLPVSGATFLNGVRTADGTIIDDEVAYRISGSNLSRDEGQSGTNAFVFTVNRQGQSVAGTVDWALTPGANFAASDLSPAVLPTGGTLTFAATESVKNITILVNGDTTVEADETFSIALSNPVAAGGSVSSVIAPSAGALTATVLNDDTDISITAIDAAKVEGHSGQTPFTFNIVRTGKLDAASVNYNITGTNVDAADIPVLNGNVALAANQATTTITVMVNGDRVAEADETFTVTLNSASSGVLRTVTANGIIQADDVVFDLALSSPSSQAEGGTGTTTNFVYQVSRDGKLSGSQVLSWSVSGHGSNQADAATDFVNSSGMLTFSANQLTSAITVGVKGDYASEADEGFRLTLSSTSGDDLAGVVFTTSTADATIVNDEASLYIAATDTNKLEGNAGTASHVFTVTRTGNMNLPVTVNWALGSGDTSVEDFSGAVSGSLSFAAGDASKLITVTNSGDVVTESDEAFSVVLSGASTGANIITGTANGSIISDDQSWSIEAVRDIVTEGDTGATSVVFRITREGGQAATSIDWTASATGGAPASTVDFLPATYQYGNVNFAQGQMTKLITVSVQGDSVFESDETFRVTLTPASDTLTHNLLVSSADATIRNDDDVMNIAATGASIQTEGQTAMVFQVTRSGSLSGNSTVGWDIDGLNSNGLTTSDFISTSGTVTFTDAQGTVSLTILSRADRDVESNEDFTVSLHTPGLGSSLGSQSSASGQIRNDDVDLSITATTGSGLEGDTGDLLNQTTAVGSAVFTVSRTGDLSALSSVHWAVETGTAVAADFPGNALPSGDVTFAAGQSSLTVTVNFAGDAADEGDQTFTVRLSGQSSEADIVSATANGTIVNDDDSLAILRYSTLSDAAEGNTGYSSYVFRVSRSGTTVGDASANWSAMGSGEHAVSNAEFIANSGTVSFINGQSEAFVTVQVKGDTAGEYDEGFTVTLSQPSFGSTITTSSASGTVRNDDPVITLVDNQPAGKAEGVNGASTAYTFKVIRSGNTTDSSSVEWVVEPVGDAPANAMDFGGAYPSGLVQFAAGQGTVVVTVEVLGDASGELDETFAFKLRNAVNADILESEIASVEILNDDAGMYIEQVGAAAKAEGQAGVTTDFVYKITRVFDLTPSSVYWAVGGVGDYQADKDDFVSATLPAGTISFASGVSVAYLTVGVLGDNVASQDEGFQVTLSNNPNLIVETASSVVLNDDSLVALRSDVTLSQAEGNQGQTTDFVFTAVRSGATSLQAVAGYSVTGSGANPVDATDFVGSSLPTGLITFAASQTTKTITISVNGDALAEANESFTLAITDNGNPGVMVDPSSAQTSATILGDDKGVLLFSANTVQTEGGVNDAKALTFRVLRTGDLSGDLLLDYSFSGAVNSDDIVGGLTGSLTMVSGLASQMLTLYAHGDADVELNETFQLSLSGAEITTAVANGMLLADDDGIVVSAPVTSIIEGTGSGLTEVVFNVVAQSAQAQRVVRWHVPLNSADGVENTDFVGSTEGYLTFSAAGTQSVTVKLAQDSTIERDEMLRLDWTTDLGGGSSVVGSFQSGVRVTNDDQPGVGNDTIEGSAVADVLSGMGGIDTIRGYEGDDVLIVNAGNLASGDLNGTMIYGGEGLDTLYFDVANADLDMTLLLNNINSIERLDISGIGANKLTVDRADLSTFSEIFDLDDVDGTTFKQLIVDGDSNDDVVLVDFNANAQAIDHFGVSYQMYQSADLQVLINSQIQVQVLTNPT